MINLNDFTSINSLSSNNEVSTTTNHSKKAHAFNFPEIVDHINGAAKISFADEYSSEIGKHCYEVTVLGKRLNYPTCTDVSEYQLCFIAPQKIQFDIKNTFYKITVIDETGLENTLYIDPLMVINQIAYYAFSYIPKVITSSETLKKIRTFQSHYPDIHFAIFLFNRHGLAFIGVNKENISALYWANPSEKEINEIDCSTLTIDQEGNCLAKSSYKDLCFVFKKSIGFLNSEEAAVEKVPSNKL
jgi:hypothetical protein